MSHSESLRQQPDAPIQILPKACMCGHDHTTARGEEVYLCLECRCEEYVARCQNCGEQVEVFPPTRNDKYEACSMRCLTQLEYAAAIREKG